jgi:hypothetical protein
MFRFNKVVEQPSFIFHYRSNASASPRFTDAAD